MAAKQEHFQFDEWIDGGEPPAKAAARMESAGNRFSPLALLPDQSGVVLHEVGYVRRNERWAYSSSSDSVWHLFFNARAGHKVVFGHTEHPLTPDHVMLIPGGHSFAGMGQGAVPHCWMKFALSRRLAGAQAVPLLLTPRPIERQLLGRLGRQFDGASAGGSEGILHCALALLHLLLGREEILWQRASSSEALLRAVRRMGTAYATQLEVAELARTSFYLSVRSFNRAFKQHRGVSPVFFLTRVRVREAADLLAHTDASLEQIAEQTGFANRHYFSRVFKRVIGDSPAHFRHRQNCQSAETAAL